MTVSTKHSLYSVVFNTDLLGGITRQTIRTGTTVVGEALGGEPWPRQVSLSAQEPGAEFTTVHVADALDLCALAGTDIDGLAAGLILYAYAAADGATRAGAGAHRKYSIADGIVFPQRLSCQHRGDAELSYQALATWDGENDPVVIADDQSVPASADGSRFSLGPVTIGSKSLPAVRSLDVDFGIQARAESADSDKWPTFVSIARINPRITLRGIDVAWLKSTNIPLAGLAATHAQTTIYLRKRASGASFVADATAEHIAITAAGLCYVDSAFEGNGIEPAECSLTLVAAYDGTNDPIIFDTSSAIT